MRGDWFEMALAGPDGLVEGEREEGGAMAAVGERAAGSNAIMGARGPLFRFAEAAAYGPS